MRVYEVCLGPVMAMDHQGGVDLVSPEQVFTVNGETVAIAGEHFIIKDRNGFTQFIANRNDVRYCRFLDSIKAFKSDAVVSIVSANGVTNEEGK